MTPRPFDIGFRVLGSKTAKRRAIRHAATFAAYAECDPKVEPDTEAFLSHFVFDRAFKHYLETNGSEAAYSGLCGASWLWWDVDRADDLEAALRDARRLAGTILDRYTDLDDDDLLIFFSGSKGAHVGMPVVWQPEPSTNFHEIAKSFCLDLAQTARVVVDSSVYSKTRLFRAPNSQHPKTGLYKRRLSLEELTHLKLEAVCDLARQPEPFDIPSGPAHCDRAAADWSKARVTIEGRAERRATPRDGESKLSAFARRFLRDREYEAGQREVSTFRVAAELSEFYLANGFEGLLFALLEETALDLGLTPSETKHAIGGGFLHSQRKEEKTR